MVLCPKGHDSTDADYCSECGARIGSISLKPEEKPVGDMRGVVGTTSDICPDCGTPRTSGSRFCEVCRFDFQSKGAGVSTPVTPTVQVAAPVTPTVQTPVVTMPIAQTTPVAPPIPDLVAANSPTITGVAERLNVIVTVDPSLVTDGSLLGSCPKTGGERVFPLDLDENLVGRRSDGKGVYPEVEVNDPGASHRHVKFIKQTDGTFAVLELGSANGTVYNGADLEPGVLTRVKAGDELLIGMWTRLQLRARG